MGDPIMNALRSIMMPKPDPIVNGALGNGHVRLGKPVMPKPKSKLEGLQAALDELPWNGLPKVDHIGLANSIFPALETPQPEDSELAEFKQDAIDAEGRVPPNWTDYSPGQPTKPFNYFKWKR